MRWFYCSVFALSLAVGCSSSEFAPNTPENETDTGSRIDDDVDNTPVTIGGDVGGRTDVAVPDVPPDQVVEAWIPATGDFVMRDAETGTLWNVRGEAFEGPLKGAKLEQVPSFNAFWFAWSVFYNGSSLWNRDEPNTTAPLEGSDNCLVPCDEIRLGCGGGRDCIPALDYDGRDDRPVAKMVTPDSPEAAYLSDGDTVLGIAVDGEARAYPHNILWWHEIYNDKIGDKEFTVTLCPLTGSGIVFSGVHSSAQVDYGVSGNLFNSNLVMYDRDGDTLWSQMWVRGITGSRTGERMEVLPVVETTWRRWQEMYPSTVVASEVTGHARNYNSYPYGDYRTNHSDTFRPTNPPMSDAYDAKDLIMGLVGNNEERAYAFVEMEQFGDRVVINDTFEGASIVVLFEAQHHMSLPFYAAYQGQTLTFEGQTAP